MTNIANSQDRNREVKLEIVYYTDPLCCWSWAFEPQWRRLRYEFGEQIRWRYCMGGLLPNWETFSDPMNAVSRPMQMGPLWFEAKHISGMPINERIWVTDPPASSYPGCIAVKCAALQSPIAEEKYLRALREAVLLNGKNISKESVLLDLAGTLNRNNPGVLNLQQFENDYQSGAGHQPFRDDLQRVRYHKISRFPTLTIINNTGKGVFITGYRPYEVLLQAIAQVAPSLQQEKKTYTAEAYKAFWGSVTEREAKEMQSAEKAMESSSTSASDSL